MAVNRYAEQNTRATTQQRTIYNPTDRKRLDMDSAACFGKALKITSTVNGESLVGN